MEIQKSAELSSVVNTDCVRRDFAEKPFERVNAIRDYGASPAFQSCGLSADVAGSAANDYDGGSTYDTLQSFIDEEIDSGRASDAYLASYGSLIDAMPPGNVSDNGKVVCEAEDDGVDERSFESAAFQRSQLAFNQNTSSSGFYSKEDAEVNESLNFSYQTREQPMKEKDLFGDFSIDTPMRPDESVLSPVQDIARNFQEFNIDRGLDARFGSSSAISRSRLTPGLMNFSSAEHLSEVGMGVVSPPPLRPPLSPPPTSATSAAHHVKGVSAGLNISGLSYDSEESMVASSSSVASAAIRHASFSSQLSLMSEQFTRDTEDSVLASPPPRPPPFVSPGLSDLAVATCRWLKKSGKASLAILRADFLPDQICSGHITVECKANNLVSLAVNQYAEMAEKWFNTKKKRPKWLKGDLAQKTKRKDSYDFKLAFRKTFDKYGKGKTKVERINNGAGRKFVLCEKVSQGILEEMENQVKCTDDKRLPDLSSGAHQAMGVDFDGGFFPRASLAEGVCVGESLV